MAPDKNIKGEGEIKIERSTTTSTEITSTSQHQQHQQQRYSQDDNQQQQYTREQQQERQEQEQQHHAINRALDETKDNIRKTTDEARSQIPRYTQAVNDYQEQTIQAAREIADSYLDSQRQIINALQSAWSPYAESMFRMTTTATPYNWMVSPRQITELYANMVSSFANNMIAMTRLTNNMIFANMEAFKTSIQQTKDNTKEFSRIGVNAAKTFEQQQQQITEAASRDSTRRQQQRQAAAAGGTTTTTTRVSVGTEEAKVEQDKSRKF